MKKLLAFPAVLLLLAAVVFVGGVFWWKDATGAPSTPPPEERFLITRGASAQQIANNLENAGIIKSALSFKLYTQSHGVASSIPPGQFVFSGSQDLAGVVETLLKGPTELWTTVPEGLRREQVPELFIASLGLTEEEAAVFREEFLDESRGREGYLFPDTYLFPPDTSGARVATVMQQTFDQRFPGATDKVVILASLIERESRKDSERPTVAGILQKRLDAGWALNVDATVQYAIATENCGLNVENCDNWWPTISRADYEHESPYNTYQFSGLPPTPIANPGLSSLEAAASPETSPYWYYIHDAGGTIHYAETLEEHNGNVAQYLR